MRPPCLEALTEPENLRALPVASTHATPDEQAAANERLAAVQKAVEVRLYRARQEGEPVFKGTGLRMKSHIQIAVRNPAAIVGYFKPENL